MGSKTNNKQTHYENIVVALKIKLKVGEGKVQGIKAVDKRLYMTTSLISPLLKLYLNNVPSLRNPSLSSTL
jgi:hypothetical protein